MLDINIPFLLQHRKAWLVGGAIRDILLGKQPTDFDIISAENGAEYAQELARHMGGKSVVIGKFPFNIYRVIAKGCTIDVTRLNGSSIEQDLNKRDFTINSLAWQVNSDTLIDLFNGQRDLHQKRIRMVAPSIFKDDPIRLLRAFRLAGTLEFQIDRKTLTVMHREVFRIQDSAAERIQSELLKILATPGTTAAIVAMDRVGLIEQILPEVTNLKNCHQNHFHDTNVFEHTIRALAALEKLIPHYNHLFTLKVTSNPHDRLVQKPEHLKLALLLHDIGKPLTSSVDQKGCRHFYGHDRIGAQIVDGIARRLTLSNHLRHYLKLIIGSHLHPIHLFNAHQKDNLSDRAVIRLYGKTGRFTPDLLLHSAADVSGKKQLSDKIKSEQRFIRFIDTLLERYLGTYSASRKRPPLLMGRDLIHHFKLKPSPLFKTILTAVEEQRLTGQL